MIAAVADVVHEVTQLAGAAVEPPELGEAWGSRFMRGLGRRAGTFVTLLDLEQLFRGAELALIASGR
jgi:purine-binding chemotaxis protein CheW